MGSSGQQHLPRSNPAHTAATAPGTRPPDDKTCPMLLQDAPHRSARSLIDRHLLTAEIVPAAALTPLVSFHISLLPPPPFHPSFPLPFPVPSFSPTPSPPAHLDSLIPSLGWHAAPSLPLPSRNGMPAHTSRCEPSSGGWAAPGSSSSVSPTSGWLWSLRSGSRPYAACDTQRAACALKGEKGGRGTFHSAACQRAPGRTKDMVQCLRGGKLCTQWSSRAVRGRSSDVDNLAPLLGLGLPCLVLWRSPP
eukprot:352743-Chlamydomonas_euryale.AAC.8